jgi:hypothetical protein
LKGISFFGRSMTMRVFVDDVAIFTDVDTDLTISEKVLDDFCKWTSSRLKKTKSKDLGLGGWRRRTTWLVDWSLEVFERFPSPGNAARNPLLRFRSRNNVKNVGGSFFTLSRPPSNKCWSVL